MAEVIAKSKDSFWRVLALAALLLCGWLALSRGGSDAHADNGGAASDGLIALMGVNPADERLYLIDTREKTVLVYENNGADLKFVTGRTYEYDAAYLSSQKGLLKYEAKGYNKQVWDHLMELERKAGK